MHVDISTCAAEYISASQAVQTTQWLRHILAEINALPSTPTTVRIDNQAAIAVATNTAPTRKRKMIDLRRNFVRKHIQKGGIRLEHVPSKSMLADILTKPLKTHTFNLNEHAVEVVENPQRHAQNNCTDQTRCTDSVIPRIEAGGLPLRQRLFGEVD